MRYVAFIALLLFMFGCTPAPQPSGSTSITASPQVTASCSSGLECLNIGLDYVGNAQYKTAAAYFRRSCDLGSARGCNNIAFLYANARGVEQSYTLAYRYWGKACRMGNQGACNNLQLAKDKVAEMKKNQ